MKYKNQIKKIIQLKKDIFGIEEIKSIKISRLGAGENNLSLLATINNRIKLVFRIGLRKKFEKIMKHEFETLKTLPKNFAPKPLYFDNSKKIIPRVYSVLSYIEGKHIKRWTRKHLKLHAKKLAELHKKKFPYDKKTFDVYKIFLKEIKDSSGDTLKDKDIKLLLPKISQYIKENNHYFTSLKRFPFIHGDPYVDNILFSKRDVHYIDWEWAKIGDNAEDVSRFFDEDCSYLPWVIKLSGSKLKFFLNTYLKHHDDKTLRTRIKIWSLYYEFMDLLYFKWKLKNWKKEKSDLTKDCYEKAVKTLTKILKKKLK
jgi:thiamine kinase-like enzyme